MLNLIILLLFNRCILSLNKNSIALYTKRVKARRLILLILILQNKDMWSNILIELILLLFINLRLSLISLLPLSIRN